MRSSTLLVLSVLASACAPPVPTLTDAERERVTTEVRAVTDSVTAAMDAHDVDALLGFFDLTPGFVNASCTEFLFGGDLFASITRSYHAGRKDVVFDIRVVSIEVQGPGAATVVLQTESSDPRASNPILTTRAMSRGAGGRWRIVSQHQSWPGCASPRPAHPMTSAETDTIG